MSDILRNIKLEHMTGSIDRGIVIINFLSDSGAFFDLPIILTVCDGSPSQKI